MPFKFLNFLFFTLIMMSCSKTKGVYEVQKIETPIQLTGSGQDEVWEEVPTLIDFSYPWREENAPLTEFKALYDDTHFYFLYRAIDPDIITKKEALAEKAALNSDRIELFFKGIDDAQPYYSLELDALGRTLDTKATFGQKVDFDWTWPANELIVKSSIDDFGYWVEGRISFASLRELGLYHDDNILRTGLYRAEYVKGPNGKVSPKWISWIKPDSKTPNFHIPSSFGTLILNNE